jgi:hypothetical protein
VRFGLAKAANAHTAGGIVALEGVMETPEEVAVMRQLLEGAGAVGGSRRSWASLVQEAICDEKTHDGRF